MGLVNTSQLLRVVLESAGADVTTIASPVTALERMAAVQPQVLSLAVPDPSKLGAAGLDRL